MTPSSDGAIALEHSAASAAFDVWFERFLDTVLTRHPVDATYLGAHAYDHALPDFSRAADADWVTQANALIAALDAIPADGISEAQLYDRILARGALQLWIQEASAPQFQSGNPVHHTSQAIAGVAALFQDDGWPHEERVAAVIARMQAVPAFLETARRRMRSAPLVWTELAIRQAEACAAYVGALPSRDIAIDRLSFQQAASKAATAFDGHATWLRNVLAERRPAVQPAGTAALDRYLHLGHLLPAAQTPEWWFDYAHAELIEATTELRELAKAIDWRVPIRVLLRRLDDAHPNAEAYDAAIPAAWERCRAITIGARLVTWPDVPVHFAAIPAAELEFWRTFSFPIYRGAPPLARRERGA